MSEYDAIAKVIRARVRSQVLTGAYSTTKVQFDNAPDPKPAPTDTWIRSTIQWETSDQIETGVNDRFTYPGRNVLQVFHPIDLGQGKALELVDVIVAAFRNVTDGGVQFEAPSANLVGRTEHWWQTNVECPFYTSLVAAKP